MLNMITHGATSPENQPPLIIVHGLFGSARNWGVIANRLSDTRQVIAVDMRNHGNSPWMEDQTYPAMAEDLQEVIAEIGGPVDLLGHSMGGKAAMVAALGGANLRRLIVADIAPVSYGHTQQHHIDALQALPLSKIITRTDADKFLATTVEDPTIRSFLLQSLNLMDKSWRLNLTALTKDMVQILSFPTITGAFEGSALFLTGATSDYVRTEHRPIIKNHFPKARFAKIPNAGHWLHAERPRAFETAVRVFLDAF